MDIIYHICATSGWKSKTLKGEEFQAFVCSSRALLASLLDSTNQLLLFHKLATFILKHLLFEFLSFWHIWSYFLCETKKAVFWVKNMIFLLFQFLEEMNSVITACWGASGGILASERGEKQKPEKSSIKTTPIGVPISIRQATYLIHQRIRNIFEQGKFTMGRKVLPFCSG